MFENIYLASDDNDHKEQCKSILENSSSSLNPQSTAISFASPKEYTGSIQELKDLSKTFYASILEQPQESENSEELQQFYCENCKKLTSPIMSIRVKSLSLLNSVRFFFDSLKCCNNTPDLTPYHEYIYSCSLCNKIKA